MTAAGFSLVVDVGRLNDVALTTVNADGVNVFDYRSVPGAEGTLRTLHET